MIFKRFFCLILNRYVTFYELSTVCKSLKKLMRKCFTPAKIAEPCERTLKNVKKKILMNS